MIRRYKQPREDGAWQPPTGLPPLHPQPGRLRALAARLGRALGGLGWWGWVCLLTMLILLGVAGRMDQDEAEMQAGAYCAMVHDGTWPDWRGDYAARCKDGKPR